MAEFVAPHHFARGDAPPSWMPHVEEVPLEGARCATGTRRFGEAGTRVRQARISARWAGSR